jgi:hypothetical protein
MGTRGFFGFVIDGVEKIAYNHFDSYPSGLGKEVLSWCWANRHALTCDIHRGEVGGPVDLARKLQVVDPNSSPTAEQIERLKGYANLNVGEQVLDDWYALLRETQGKPAEILKAGYMEDAGTFPQDSLYAEYGYLVDLDAQVFEAYRGFQDSPHDKGRFATREKQTYTGCEYWPCALVASWSLEELPSEDELDAAFNKGGGDE